MMPKNLSENDLDPSGEHSCRLGRGGVLYIRADYLRELLAEARRCNTTEPEEGADDDGE